MRKTQYDQLKDLSQEIDLLKREVFFLRSANLKLAASEAALIKKTDQQSEIIADARRVQMVLLKRVGQDWNGVVQ